MAKIKVEDMALTYTGRWAHTCIRNGSMESRHDTDGNMNPGASACWSGYLTGFELYGTKLNRGLAEVRVDGISHGFADYSSDTTQHGVLLFKAEGLPAGLHSIELRALEGCVNIDFLIVDFVQPQPNPYRSIVCIGDSITFGANVAVRPDHLFGRVLQRMLYVPVSIHGLSGAGIALITDVLDAVVAPRNPDLVLWLAGMNNPNPQASMEAGLERLFTCAPDAQIIAATIPYNTYYTPEQNLIKVQEVQRACQAKGVPCADLYTPTFGNAYLNQPENTVHPNDEGHGVIAGLFYKEILRQWGGGGRSKA